jgi:putative membrane protein
MWDGHEGMGWWMLLGTVWFVLFWGAVIWAVATLASRLTRGESGGTTDRESPLDIAKRRYASGEISKEEFDRLRADLL